MREHFLHEYFRTLIEPGGKQGEGILRGVLVHILLLIDGRHRQKRGLCCGLSDCGIEIICNLFPLSNCLRPGQMAQQRWSEEPGRSRPH